MHLGLNWQALCAPYYVLGYRSPVPLAKLQMAPMPGTLIFSRSKKKEPRYACLSEANASHSQRMWTEVSSLVPHMRGFIYIYIYLYIYIYTRQIYGKCHEYSVEHHMDLLATCKHKLQHYFLRHFDPEYRGRNSVRKVGSQRLHSAECHNLYKHRHEYLQPYNSNLTYITALWLSESLSDFQWLRSVCEWVTAGFPSLGQWLVGDVTSMVSTQWKPGFHGYHVTTVSIEG
jgi:hypothetical protein